MSEKKKILHVEDDRNIQLLVRVLLERAGYAVVTAADAMQAVMMARQNAPDLIILDIMIPAGGGQGVFERVRNLTTIGHVPILIYSANPKSMLESGIAFGSDVVFLQKPAGNAEILATVKDILEGRAPAS